MFTEGQDVSGICGEILRGPEKPITDKGFILEKIIAPWMKAVGERSHYYLSSTHPLVAALIAKYGLPSPGKYKLDQLPLASDFPSTRNQWELVAHCTSAQGSRDIEQMGGILGIQVVHTFWTPPETMKALSGEGIGGFDDAHVFVVPRVAVAGMSPALKITDYNPAITPDKLPDLYVAKIDDGAFAGKREALFQQTCILPIDYRIGKINLRQ